MSVFKLARSPDSTTGSTKKESQKILRSKKKKKKKKEKKIKEKDTAMNRLSHLNELVDIHGSKPHTDQPAGFLSSIRSSSLKSSS